MGGAAEPPEEWYTGLQVDAVLEVVHAGRLQGWNSVAVGKVGHLPGGYRLEVQLPVDHIGFKELKDVSVGVQPDVDLSEGFVIVFVYF